MTPLDYQPVLELRPRRISRAFVIVGLAIALSLSVGTVTNAINGLVSIPYFQAVMPRVPWTLGRVITQGIIESFGVAVLLSLVVVPTYCAVTGCRYPLRNWIWAWWVSAAIAIGMHFIGGIVGLTLARFSPVTFTQLFPVAERIPPYALSAFGYVGGAIWGVFAGGLGSAVLLITTLITGWRRDQGSATTEQGNRQSTTGRE